MSEHTPEVPTSEEDTRPESRRRRSTLRSILEPLRVKSLRVHLVLAALVTSMAYLLVLGAAVFIPLMIKLGGGPEAFEEASRAADRMLFLHANFWPVGLTAILAVCLGSLYLFHKTTQPLVRFRRVFQSVGEGLLPDPIRLRLTDFLAPDAEALNEMLESLRLHIGEIRREQEALAEVVGELQEASTEGNSQALRALIERLAHCDKQLEDQLRFFQLEA